MQETCNFSWSIGGQQGEGIESAGEIFSSALNRLGFFLYCHRHFSSRIKGGHTSYSIRLASRPVRTSSGRLDILIALDQESVDLARDMFTTNSIILADTKLALQPNADCGATVIPVPCSEIAEKCGSPFLKNLVMLGASAALFGISAGQVHPALDTVFSKKGEQILMQNKSALQAGIDFIENHSACPKREKFILIPPDTSPQLLMMGNEAIALGAIAAGARFMAAYPITPASDIMEYLIKKFPQLGGAVIQTEDEIAACTMAIGANYGGARAFTATSGPGFSLMAEAIGLSGMTETPLVVIDCQRGGPSTGLPTKQEQSDIVAAIFNTHGDTPKIVMCPGTAEEAFYDTFEAFNLAEEYQCPVILLSDLQLSLCKQTLPYPRLNDLAVRRGKLAGSELPALGPAEYFKRFAATVDGISPRTLPGTRNGIHLVTGLEHDAAGKPAEAPDIRRMQTDKRHRKLDTVIDRFPAPLYIQAAHPEADLLIVGVSATRGAIEEAVELLGKEGYKINHIHFRLLHPFPAKAFQAYVQSAQKTLVVEHNRTGQLLQLIRMHIADENRLTGLTKYDGEFFSVAEILSKCREVLA